MYLSTVLLDYVHSKHSPLVTQPMFIALAPFNVVPTEGTPVGTDGVQTLQVHVHKTRNTGTVSFRAIYNFIQQFTVPTDNENRGPCDVIFCPHGTVCRCQMGSGEKTDPCIGIFLF